MKVLPRTRPLGRRAGLPRRASTILVALAAGLLSVALTACGGSQHSTSATTHAATTTSGGSSGASAKGGSSVTTGPVHATLKGQNHHPVVRKNWTYTVTATDAHGHPLSGTAETEFAFQGAVVGHETPPTHPLKQGHLKDMLQFPAQSVGYPVELRVVVHTKLGSVTLNWPVTVQK